MGDAISKEDRALIDEAVAEGRVKVIPVGRSGLNADIVFDASKNRLVYKDPKVARAALSTTGIFGPKRKRKAWVDPAVTERRKQVADLVESGCGTEEIMDRLGISRSVVYGDVRVLGISISRQSADRSRFDPVVAKHREKVRAVYHPKRTTAQIANLTGLSRRTVADHLKALGLKPSTGKSGPGPTSARARAKMERRSKIPALVMKGMGGVEIARELGATPTTIYKDCSDLGIELPKIKRGPKSGGAPKRRRGPNVGDRAAIRKAEAAAEKVEKVKDRRRFRTTPVPMGEPSVVADAGAQGTIFPTRVFQPVDVETVLKDGCNQSKIGGDVLVGWLEGARIYTLTLEERATCPTACRHWRSCYGNSMPHARRWAYGDALMAKIESEIADLCLRHERVLVRLHILGDFWSVEYVDFWGRLLERHSGLSVFGFTAHKQGTEIGDYIAAIRGMHPRRFWMRHSDMTGPWGSFTIDFPTSQKTIGDAIVCPEQAEAMSGDRRGRHCGNCGICWSSDRPIVFVTH